MDGNGDYRVGNGAPSKAENEGAQLRTKPSKDGVRFGDSNEGSKSPREGVRFAPPTNDTVVTDRGRRSRERSDSYNEDMNTSAQTVGVGNRAANESNDRSGEHSDIRFSSFRKYVPFLSTRGGGPSPMDESISPRSTKAETPRSTKSEVPKPNSPGTRMRKTLGNILSPTSRPSPGPRPEKRRTFANLAYNFTQSRDSRVDDTRSPGTSPAEEVLRREPTGSIFKRRARSASRGPRRGRERFRGIGAFFSSSAARRSPRPPGAAQEPTVAPGTATSSRLFAVTRSKQTLSPSPVRGDSKGLELRSSQLHKARSADDRKAS